MSPGKLSAILVSAPHLTWALPCSNHVPWLIIGICYATCMVLLMLIRVLLVRENRRRDAEPRDTTYDDVYVEVVLPDGSRVERKVEKEYLDLTDVQNRDFRYVL